jgi:hypothetical protein
MMAISFDATQAEAELIRRIAERYEDMCAEAELPCPDRMTLSMDLSAAHAAHGLDLDGLLAARNMDFAHDVAGIHAHLDRTTGKLSGGFWPRFAR